MIGPRECQDVDQSCYGWTPEESADQDDSREISFAEMLDHGSISFGRFALEPLSWEKRSVFSHNRYQEEIEKFKAPGLVAQKKAYFEEYYKKIRAIKALEENQHTNGVEDQRLVSDEGHGNAIENVIDLPLDESSTEIGFDKNNQPALLDINSCKHESITTSIEDSVLVNTTSLGNNDVSNDFIPNDSSFSTCLPTIEEIKLDLEQKKVERALETCEGDALTSKMKEHSEVRNDMISECKTKCTVTLTHVLRNSSQRRTGKPNDNIISCKQTVDRVISRKYASFISHGPREEMRSKVTTPQPFSFSTEKRCVPSVSSASMGPYSKMMYSLPLHSEYSPKGVSNSQGMESCPDSKNLQSNREHEEVERAHFTFDRHSTGFRRKSANNIVGTLKSRYINLPAHCKADSNSGSISNRIMTIQGDAKRKQVNDEKISREAQGQGKPMMIHPTTRKIKSEKKMVQYGIRDLSLLTKKSLLGDHSHERRKPIPEKPRWR